MNLIFETLLFFTIIGQVGLPENVQPLLRKRKPIRSSMEKLLSFKSNNFAVSIDNRCILFNESAIFAIVNVYLENVLKACLNHVTVRFNPSSMLASGYQFNFCSALLVLGFLLLGSSSGNG